jgi:hypothetical protein
MIFPETLSIELTDRMFRKEQPTILLKIQRNRKRDVYTDLSVEKSWEISNLSPQLTEKIHGFGFSKSKMFTGTGSSWQY